MESEGEEVWVTEKVLLVCYLFEEALDFRVSHLLAELAYRSGRESVFRVSWA